MARRKWILLNGSLRHVIPNHHPRALGYEATFTPETLRKSAISLGAMYTAKSTSPRSRTTRRVDASGTTCRIIRSSFEGWNECGLGTKLIIVPFCQVSMTNGPDSRDCSEGAGLPPTGIYRIFRGLTFERGGQHDVRSRRVPPRPKRRDHGARRPAAARDRPVQSKRHPATVSTLWSLGLPGQAVSSDAARLGQSRRVVSA